MKLVGKWPRKQRQILSLTRDPGSVVTWCKHITMLDCEHHDGQALFGATRRYMRLFRQNSQYQP
eukprot:357499-Chlamydomonas_euryale.AAC.4